MALSVTRGLWSLGFLVLALAGPVSAAESGRNVVTTDNSDYFGFDLRSEQNLTLDQCKTACLGDSSCRAFTYNTKAKWCFLKSDYNQLKPFSGAVAGKIVNVSGEPDIGAPPELTFFPGWMADEARQVRESMTTGATPGTEGLASLVSAGQQLIQGDPRAAMRNFTSAIAITPDDSTLWVSLARAALAISASNSDETTLTQRNAVAGAWNGYQVSRTKTTRADALRVLAQGLDRRDYFRPALQAYEAERLPRARAVQLQARQQFLNNRMSPAPPPLSRDWIFAHDASLGADADIVPAAAG